MGSRARLSRPPLAFPENWPLHEVQWTSIPADVLRTEDRRLEAETYLCEGYGIRLAVESHSKGWTRLGDVASVWQPSRLKGVQVSPEHGVPFLSASQVFETRAFPRKWLAVARTPNVEQRFVSIGTILVSCSGHVGRATLAFSAHVNAIITHDLLRVEPNRTDMKGWLYFYLRAPRVRAMMAGARYGDIIKHLEPSHIDRVPVLAVNDGLRRRFNESAERIVYLRDSAYAATLEAERRFDAAMGPLESASPSEAGFVVDASSTLFGGRRRFDAARYNPRAAAIERHFAASGRDFVRLRDAGYRAWLPTRFRRIPADAGTALIDSSDIFEINPDLDKRIANVNCGDSYNGRVEPGWLLLARSGQVYGLNGSLALAHEGHVGKIVSDHIIRIASVGCPLLPAGYLLTALSHPTFGRPLMKALPYGSSVPEIDVTDLQELNIPRLGAVEERQIADLAERSAKLYAEADLMETEAASEADRAVAEFMMPRTE